MEPNDTLLTATQTGIDIDEFGEFTFSGEIGDNPDIEAKFDVDLYAFELTEKTRITVASNASDSNSSFEPVLRIFDTEGNELASDFGVGTFLSLRPPATGTYYLGVSRRPNFEYDPNVAGSGFDPFPVPFSTSNYELVITKSEFEMSGLVGGAQLVKDISPGIDNFNGASNFTELDGKLFFTANDGVVGTELWVSDGTADGTQLLKDINTGQTDDINSPDGVFPASSYASNFTEIDGKLFFIANDGVVGTELWVSDGTADGTQLLKDTNTDRADYIESRPLSGPSGFTELDGKLFFSADDGITGRELWVSDGTTDGTLILKDINAVVQPPVGPRRPGSNPSGFTELDGKLFFSADDGITGSELWVSDGTADGTQLLKDINITDRPFLNGSNPSGFTELDGKLFFAAADEITGRELWVSDGTADGTQLLKDIDTEESPSGFFSGSNPSQFTEVDGKLFFSTNRGMGNELWVSDGTADGTQLLKDINIFTNFAAFDGKLFFSADDGVTGTELWVSDGTADGTQLLKDIDLGAGSSDPGYLTVAGNLLFFTTNDGFIGRELWVSDGTTTGTQLFQDINSGADGSNPGDLTVVGDQLFFSATDGTTGNALWAVTIPDQLISGDENNNVLKGTQGNDLIYGLGGNDIIRGRRGNDILNGSDGDDILWGNGGDDTIGGGTGSDQLFGNQGHDDLHGGMGDDFLNGGTHNDTLNGDAGDDFLRGGKGNDQLTGGTGQDSLFAGQGADTLTGGIGNDFLRGGQGADTFRFEADLLDGIADTDTIQRFESEDSLDFSAYLDAGGSIDATRVTSRLLSIELGGEDIINVLGKSHALDVAQDQL